MSSPKIKILELRTVSGTGGGPEKTIFMTARKINPERFETHIIYTRNKKDPEFNWMKRRYVVEGAYFYQDYVEKYPFDWNILKHLFSYCRNHKIDIVHSHEYKTDVMGALLKRKLPVKWVSTFHLAVYETLKLRLYQALAYRFLRKADLIMTVCSQQKDLLEQKKIDSNRIIVLPNGIDTEIFQPNDGSSRMREIWKIPNDQMVVGFMGRLNKQKNIPLLLEAFGEVLKQEPSIHLMIAGEGPLRGKLERQVAEKGFSQQVHFLGFLTDTVPFYEAIDIFAQASDIEGMPNAVLEAMALGKPVVATAVGGVPELIQDGEEGILVEKGSAEGLARAVLKLIQKAELRKRMGKKGREKVVNRFSFDARVRKLEEIYERLCEGVH